MSKLKARLEMLKPGEADAELALLWKQFADTPYFEALLLAVDDMREKLLTAVVSPNVTDQARCHSAGGLNALQFLVQTIRAALHFNASEAVYSDSGAIQTDTSDPIATE
jgi:hypothetical protein